MSSIQSTLLLEVNSSDLSLLPLPVVTYLFQAGVLCPQITQKGLLWAKFIQRIWMPILIILWWKCQIQHHNQKNMPNKTPFTPYSYQIHHHNTNTKSLQIPITPQCWFTCCFVKHLNTFWRIINFQASKWRWRTKLTNVRCGQLFYELKFCRRRLCRKTFYDPPSSCALALQGLQTDGCGKDQYISRPTCHPKYLKWPLVTSQNGQDLWFITCRAGVLEFSQPISKWRGRGGAEAGWKESGRW